MTVKPVIIITVQWAITSTGIINIICFRRDRNDTFEDEILKLPHGVNPG